jgi:hypothetical protein
MSDDILSRLHKESEGIPGVPVTATVYKLLREAAAEIESLREQVEVLYKRLRERGGKRGDDDGAEVIFAGPPKRPRGGLPAFATRLNDGDRELPPAVQSKVPPA